jgi:hypothetical protein
MASEPEERPSGSFDLDAMIGDLRQEAARRRAEPDFPLDEEARLAGDLDEQAPGPGGPRLARLADRAEAVTQQRGSAAGRRTARLIPAPRSSGTGEALASVARILAEAVRTTSSQLKDLDRRLDRLEHQARDIEPFLLPTGSEDGSPLDAERLRLADLLAGRSGRVLYWGTDPGAQVAALRSRGIDAYGLDPGGDPYKTGPDVHHGDLLAHLRSVDDEALAAVIAVGPAPRPSPLLLEDLASELARSSAEVLVASEAPWWWQSRVGSEQADLAMHRPLGAESWLAILHRSGFSVRAEYAAGGSTYLVTASAVRSPATVPTTS